LLELDEVLEEPDDDELLELELELDELLDRLDSRPDVADETPLMLILTS
jgi:hypothetical protein